MGQFIVYVPGGEFTMGADANRSDLALEQPEQKVTTPGFWLQRTEVTNAQYGRCVAAKACKPPTNQRWNQAEYAEHPVTDVKLRQAMPMRRGRVAACPAKPNGRKPVVGMTTAYSLGASWHRTTNWPTITTPSPTLRRSAAIPTAPALTARSTWLAMSGNGPPG